MPKFEALPNCLVHVRTFPLNKNIIEARGSCSKRNPFMRNIVHFALGEKVTPVNQDWVDRKFVCAIIVPFTQEIQNQVHSFHLKDVTFVDDFQIPLGSTILYINGFSPESYVEGIRYIEVNHITENAIQGVLNNYNTISIPVIYCITLLAWMINHSMI